MESAPRPSPDGCVAALGLRIVGAVSGCADVDDAREAAAGGHLHHRVSPRLDRDRRTTLDTLARQTGTFTVQFCRTGADVQSMLSAASLRGFDAVAFVNTTGNLGLPDLPAFLAGSRTDMACRDTQRRRHLSRRTGVSRHARERVPHPRRRVLGDAIVENPTHPASAMLGQRFAIFDEIYRFVRGNRGQATMLLSLDRQPLDGLPGQGEPADLPLAWAKAHGAGRVFYTALGHRDDVWRNVSYRQHIGAGLQWVLGLPPGLLCAVGGASRRRRPSDRRTLVIWWTLDLRGFALRGENRANRAQ